MEIEIPDPLLEEEIKLEKLSPDWFRLQNMKTTQSIGHTWQLQGRSGVLKVPSSIIGEEANFVLNTRHVDFNSIRIVNTRSFDFDARFGHF